MKTVITAEIKRRMDLVNDVEFIKLCAQGAEKIGITAREFNTNRAMICLLFANEFCSIENKNTFLEDLNKL